MLDSLLNFFFFPFCTDCQAPGQTICPQCLDRLEVARLKCHRCDCKNPFGIYCKSCATKYTPAKVLSLYHFDDTAKELIHGLKYEDEKELASIFAQKLADFTGGLKVDGFAVSPVPISKKRRRWRGYNQAELIARSLAEKTGLEFADILQKSNKHSQVLAGTRDERKANIKGAFSTIADAQIPAKILLIDDVVTTGATVEEATKTLKLAGAREVIVLAVAMG